MSRLGAGRFLLGVQGVNIKCSYLDAEAVECRLVEDGGMPRMNKDCDCARCLVALHQSRRGSVPVSTRGKVFIPRR